MKTRKQIQHNAIRARAATALANLYHNATPRYPCLDGEAGERFQDWFEFAAQSEIEYIAGGGAYSGEYHEDRQPWGRISEYGRLYQWGRGGRTVAPEDLIQQRGGSSFSIREDYADGLPVRDVVKLIQIVESFNSYVSAWCDSVPEQWEEFERERIREERAERKHARDAKRAQQAARDRCEFYVG